MPRILLKFNQSVLKVIDSSRDVITIGRNLKNDIQIDNLAVSNFHARVEKHLGHFFIEDLNSTNGTYVNDKPVNKWALKDNDAVTIGKHTLVFLFDAGEGSGGEGELEELQMDKTMVLDTRRQRELQAEDGAEPGAPVGVLQVLEGKAEQSEYLLTDRLTTIGKEPTAAIRLSGLLAPKVAGYLAREGESYLLVPPDGRSKLKLNGRLVESGEPLKENDEVEAGGLKLRFQMR